MLGRLRLRTQRLIRCDFAILEFRLEGGTFFRLEPPNGGNPLNKKEKAAEPGREALAAFPIL